MAVRGVSDADGWSAEGVADQAGRIAMADGGSLEPVDFDLLK